MRELQPGDPDRLGPFEIRSRIGSGGMGVVYLGRSPSGRLAAIKLVRPEVADDEEFRARFRREIDAARRVSGAFTAGVLDADPDAARPWLASAYIEGPSLRERVIDAGPLPLPEVRKLGAGLAEALADLHRVGLVHRDVKPGNVLLAADGPRLIDFGVIRSDALAELTESGFIMGSAGYMAPEQAEGRHTGPEADVFSLGALLTFAATGRGPYGTGSAATLLLRTVNQAPDLTDVPAELRAVIQRCLAADPVDRPRDRDLIAMLAPGAEPLPEWERPRPIDAAPKAVGVPRPYPAPAPQPSGPPPFLAGGEPAAAGSFMQLGPRLMLGPQQQAQMPVPYPAPAPVRVRVPQQPYYPTVYPPPYSTAVPAYRRPSLPVPVKWLIFAAWLVCMILLVFVVVGASSP
ncbi:serine/threonine protein kinase [Catenulispora sp. NF23]|uniref:serine/threonine-protein kinase n=1 Tax=Catenulispora pinistramenti TaxID=2705254 RepID=UPI001BA5FEEE|nr:serine/threonine-protein kinase [Catenulispora pinistramenti]MBS2537457.1 serine/threonine protein kinase [Catenulispora pinistramenti]